MDIMRTRRARDEQTIAIGAALGVFAVVVTAEVLGLWLLHSAFGVAAGHWDAVLGWVGVAVAGVLAIAHLVAAERRRISNRRRGQRGAQQTPYV